MSDKKKATAWGAWLTGKMAERDLSTADLVRIGDGTFSIQSVASWQAGRSVPTADVALAVAQAMTVDAAETLTAAGFDKIASAMSGPRGSGTSDPIVASILRLTLSDDDKVRLIEDFQAKVQALRERAASEAAKLLERREDGTGIN